MNDRTLEAHRRFCKAFDLSETEGSFVERLIEEITEKHFVTPDEREEWLQKLGLEMVELFWTLLGEVGLYLVYCAYEGPLEPGEPSFNAEGGWYEGEFKSEEMKFHSLLEDPLNHRYLYKAKREAFREGKPATLSGIDGEFLSLVEKLREHYPFLTFEPSYRFEFSGEGNVVGYFLPTEAEDFVTDYPLEEAQASLLHEVGHGVLAKRLKEKLGEEDGKYLFSPLPLIETLEAEAWDIAWQEAENLGLCQNPCFKEVFDAARIYGEESHAESVYRYREDEKKERDWLDQLFYG